jgi:hypothetical protein
LKFNTIIHRQHEHPELVEDEEPVVEMEIGDTSLLIDIDAGEVEEVDGSEDTNGASSGKRTRISACWDDFVPIFDDNGVRSHAICKHCGKKFAARASIGTGSLNRNMLACRKKLANDRKV